MNIFPHPLKLFKKEAKAKTIRLPTPKKRNLSFEPIRQNLPALFLLLGLSAFFAYLMNIDVFNKSYQYKVGDISERDIKASHDFMVEDKEATERNKIQISRSILPSYDYDPYANYVLEKVENSFKRARELISTISNQDKESIDDLKSKIKEEFFFLLGIQQDEALFNMLWKLRFSEQIEDTLKDVLQSVYKIGVVNFSQISVEDLNKGILLRDIASGTESLVTELSKFLDVQDAKQLVIHKIKQLKLDNISTQALLKLAPSLIHPNISYNRRNTIARIEAARNLAKPFYQVVKKGEIIVREGERITPLHLQKLLEERKQHSPIEIVTRLIGSFLINVVFLFLMYYVGLSKRGRKYFSTKDLMFLCLLLAFFSLLCLGILISLQNMLKYQEGLSSRIASYILPVASVGLIVSIFRSISASITLSIIFCIFASLISTNMLPLFFYFLSGTLMGVYNVRFAKDRRTIILSSIKVGLVNISTAVGIELYLGEVSQLNILYSALSAFLGGLLSGIFTTGLLPLIEMIFGYTNNIKLIELASLDSPLIRDLMVHAPGTYHHSVIVSSLSEAAAASVGANPILCKVASLYHDIGKTKMPLYFVENQINGENKHERLAPSMSALILMSHVKDGVELASKARLPSEIIDIIQQHHGTSLIQFFYQKAKDQAEKKPQKITINEQDFRYPGPKPQTKEAAVVMLSDAVEAASRSLEDPSPARIKGLVQQIINRTFADGQLDDCDLTLKDLHNIAKSLNTTLAGIFHQRIQYPGQEADSFGRLKAQKPEKKLENDTDKVSIKEAGSKLQGAKEGAYEGLKRLGI